MDKTRSKGVGSWEISLQEININAFTKVLFKHVLCILFVFLLHLLFDIKFGVGVVDVVVAAGEIDKNRHRQRRKNLHVIVIYNPELIPRIGGGLTTY